MSNILARCKVPAGVVADDGDYLPGEEMVAIYYDHDPDDPSPLFGDTSPEAVAVERMLQVGMMNGMPGAGGLYANINDMRCRDHVIMEESKRAGERKTKELKRSRAMVKKEKAARMVADNKNGDLEYMKHKAGIAAGKSHTREAEEFWGPWIDVRDEFINEDGKGMERAIELTLRKMENDGAWRAYKPGSDRDRPSINIIKKWLM